MTNMLKKIYYIFNKYSNIRPKVHLKNCLGFDLYQNYYDGINYKKFSYKSFNNLPNRSESNVFKTIFKYVAKDSVAIDVGSNIGLMSLFMGKTVGPHGKIYSFEPGPVSFGLLRRNIYSNMLYNNIYISDNALSDECGNFNLFINPHGESDNQLHKNTYLYKFKNEPQRSFINVPTVTLDSFINTNKIDIDKISFLKIDTQGHDLAVINGGKSFLSKTSKVAVLVEFAPYLKAWETQSISNFYEIIINLGFDIYDHNNLDLGIVNLSYLSNNYGMNRVGTWTDLLLLKGQSLN